MTSAVRRIEEVDLPSIAEALDDASQESTWWYDPSTGGVEMGLGDWMAVDADDADASERGLVEIRPVGSRPAYRDMVEFASAVGDVAVRSRLERALDGRGAFRRFRDELDDVPALRPHWLVHARSRAELRAIEWLEDHAFVESDDAALARATRDADAAAALDAVAGASAGVPATHVELVALIVDDQDTAIRFFVDAFGFELVEDSPSTTTDGHPKRWVVVRPPGAATGLLLARADGERQERAVGDQFAGRVGLFLRVDDFDATWERLLAHDVVVVREPRDEPYGRVAVVLDVAGNRWDVLGPRPDGGEQRGAD